MDKIVNDFNYEINNEICQSTKQKPVDKFSNEKEHLSPIPNTNCLIPYFYQEREYRVSKESMINYKGKKYSVPTRYIGNHVSITETEFNINIYYIKDLITSHSKLEKSEKFLNYKKDHVKEILKSDVMSDWSENSIDDFIENNLRKMDIFLSDD